MNRTRFEQNLDALISQFSQKRFHGWLHVGLIAALLSWTLVIFAQNFDPDIDVFTRIAIGSYIHQHGEVPMQDPYAFTPTKQIWHDHELIPAMLFYATDTVGGLSALFCLKLIFCLVTIVLIDKAQSRIQSRGLFSFFLLTLSILGSSIVWYSNTRAHVVTFFSYSYLLYAFSTYSSTGKRGPLMAIPFVMFVWVNSHGGFVVGMVALALYCASLVATKQQSSKTPIIILLLSTITLFATPYGASFLWFIADAITHTPRHVPTDPPVCIGEWLPPSLGSPGQSIPALFLICVAYGAYLRPGALSIEGLLLLLMTAWGGFNHIRFLPFLFLTLGVYGLTPLSVVYAHMRERFPRAAMIERSLFIWMGVMTAVGIGFSVFVGTTLSKGLPPVKTSWGSRDALDWLLANRAGGNLLTHYNEGSYALYRVHPKFKISLDGRFDGAFPLSTLDIVNAACDCSNKRHQQALSQINPDFVLTTTVIYRDVTRPSSTLCFPGYREVFSDKNYIVLERNTQ